MANRFELVDELQQDAIALVFEQRSDGKWAKVVCPSSAVQGRLPKDYNSGDLAPGDAVATAIKLANDLKAPIVVLDPDKVWKKEWGALWRWNDDSGEEEAVER